MSTGIEWTDETWNPVTGCHKVSEGCDHCYAERITERFHGKGSFEKVVLHPEKLEDPLHWRKPRRVFVNSMSDLFHDDVPDTFIARVFAVMAFAPHHTFQILTKRPGRMASLLTPRPEFVRDSADYLDELWYEHRGQPHKAVTWPLPNVWLGTSVENQKWADVRIPKLLETPAAVRFLSCEPLLGPITLRPEWIGMDPRDPHLPSADGVRGILKDDWRSPGYDFVHWVIAGGESGPGARPMHPDWARSLRDQCVAAGVPFFFKQWGEWAQAGYESGLHLLHVRGGEGSLVPRFNATMRDPYGQGKGPQDLVDRGHAGWVRVTRVGKKHAGRELDGRIWDEMPDRSVFAEMRGGAA